MVYVYESVFIFTCLPNHTEQYELYFLLLLLYSQQPVLYQSEIRVTQSLPCQVYFYNSTCIQIHVFKRIYILDDYTRTTSHMEYQLM